MFEEIPHQKDSMFSNFDIISPNKDMGNDGDMTKFMRELNLNLHVGNKMRPDIDKQRTINKVFIIVTLRQIITKLTRKVHFGTEENRYHSESIIVKPIFQVLEKQIEHESNFHAAAVQVVSEFLADLFSCLSEHDVFCKKYKTDITHLFYNENFFLMNERTLRKWQTIMN